MRIALLLVGLLQLHTRGYIKQRLNRIKELVDELVSFYCKTMSTVLMLMNARANKPTNQRMHS